MGAMWLAAVLFLTGVLLGDFSAGRFLWPARDPSVDYYDHEGGKYISIVFPGFSNPPGPFGEGMHHILGHHGPMLVVNPGMSDFNTLYIVITLKLNSLEPGRQLVLYGHSMGGQLAEMFRERYEREDSPYGPIRVMFLDCSPSTGSTLAIPPKLLPLMRVFVRYYWGGPLLALAVATGNLISRFSMPAPLAPEADRELYRRYARGLMWYNNRSWLAQMAFMLNHSLPAQPPETTVKVVYIGAADPRRDGLVRQEPAIADWREIYPEMTLLTSTNIGHAWPLEQPGIYHLLVGGVLQALA